MADEDILGGVTDSLEDMFDAERIYRVREIHWQRSVALRPTQRGSALPPITVTICIRESSFPNAGLGVFAEEDIPEGYGAEYEGRFVPLAQVRQMLLTRPNTDRLTVEY